MTQFYISANRGYRKDGGGGNLYGKFSLIDLAGNQSSLVNIRGYRND